MGLVGDPRTSDVRGWGTVQEFFLEGTSAEPGDGGQPSGNGGAGPGLWLPVPWRRSRCRRCGPCPAPTGELAQVQGRRLAGQPAVAGQEPGKRDSFGVGEDGLDCREHGGWGRQWSWSTSRPGWNREAGPVAVPAVRRKPTVSRLVRSRHAVGKREACPGGQPVKRSIPMPTLHGRRSHLVRPCFARKTPCSVSQRHPDLLGRWPRSASASCRGGLGARPVRQSPALPGGRHARAGLAAVHQAVGGGACEGPGSRAVTRNGPAATIRCGGSSSSRSYWAGCYGPKVR